MKNPACCSQLIKIASHCIPIILGFLFVACYGTLAITIVVSQFSLGFSGTLYWMISGLHFQHQTYNLQLREFRSDGNRKLSWKGFIFNLSEQGPHDSIHVCVSKEKKSIATSFDFDFWLGSLLSSLLVHILSIPKPFSFQSPFMYLIIISDVIDFLKVSKSILQNLGDTHFS